MSGFGSGLDPHLRSTVSNDLSVPGDARVESLNNQLSGLFDQRIAKSEALAMKYEALASIGADIQSLLRDIAAKQQDIADEQGKDEPNQSRISALQSQISSLRGNIDRLRNRQSQLNGEIGRIRNEIRSLDGQINGKRIEINGAERERDMQRASKQARNENQQRQIQEAEDRISQAAQDNTDIGRKIEVELANRDRVLDGQREAKGLVDGAVEDGRLSGEQLRVAWQDQSFESLTTGQAIQLMTWSLGTMPELRQAGENKFVGAGPRNDGLLAP